MDTRFSAAGLTAVRPQQSIKGNPDVDCQ